MDRRIWTTGPGLAARRITYSTKEHWESDTGSLEYDYDLIRSGYVKRNTRVSQETICF